MTNFTLRHNTERGYGIYTKKSWKKGEQVLYYEGTVVPTYMTNAKHSMTLNDHFSFEWQKESMFDYVNHSCNPNCYIDLSGGTPILVALRDISSDEEVCYNYNTVEVDFAAFPCHCNACNCIGWINGFLYLSPAQEKPILDMCSPFIKEIQAEYEKSRD